MPYTETIINGRLDKSVPSSTYETLLEYQWEAAKAKTGLDSTAEVEFNPSIHLNYYASPMMKHKFQNTRRITMEELGLTNKRQISPIGVSDPFPLFTDEAVNIMRQEVLEKQLFLNFARFSYSSTSGLDVAMRGYVKNDEEYSAPFTYKCWTHPKTMELVSKMAGVDLEVVMDFEIAHLNVSMKHPDVAKEERAITASSDGMGIPAIVDWHYDSYPFVCVLMLSDTTDMIGGETSLRMGGSEKGKVAIVPGPQQGSAAILQGRMIEHLAPSPIGMSERITMVTSYRAKDPLKNDGSVLSTVKPEINYGSSYNSFYSQWINYRVELLKERLDLLNKSSRDEKGMFQKEMTKDALIEVEKYLKDTYEEMEFTKEDYEKIVKWSSQSDLLIVKRSSQSDLLKGSESKKLLD